MEKNLKSLLPNIAITIVLIVIAFVIESLTVVLLFALVPVILALKDSINNNEGPLKYGIILSLSLIIGQLIGFLLNGNEFNYPLFIYPIGIALITSLYWLTKKNLNSNLGLFTLIIYWLSFEYLALLINPEFGNYFIFGALNKLPTINFTASTGFLGYSLWALSSNLILAFVLYDSTAPFNIKLRIISISYAIIVISAPIWLSLFWSIEGTDISKQMMIDTYSGVPISDSDYLQNGEWLGRTSAWVAVLLTIYSLVKKKITK